MTSYQTPLLWLLCLLTPYTVWGEALNCRSVFQKPAPLYSQMTVQIAKGRLPVGFDVALFPESTAARVFVEMAKQGMLLSQTSQTLEERNLLSPNGGLCASTCVTNLMGAMTAQFHNFRAFPQRAPDITHWVVEAYNQNTGGDARLGANVNVMSAVVMGLYPQILNQLDYDPLFTLLDLQLQSFDQEIYAHRIFQAMRHDTIAIASVKAHKPREFGSTTGHAVILLKVDTEKHHLYISDPNLPNEILRIPYRFHKGTEILFNLPFTFGEHPVELYQINIFRRHLSNYR